MLSKDVLKNIKIKVNDIIFNIKDNVFCIRGCFDDNNVEFFNECYSMIEEDLNTIDNIVKTNELTFLYDDLKIINIKLDSIKKMFNDNINNKNELDEICMCIIWCISLFESSFNNYGYYNITDRGNF